MKLAIFPLAAAVLFAQANWTTYSGAYNGWRHSTLDQINRANVANLKVAWVYQMPITERIESTPLVVDGVMYFTEPPSNVVALDAATGRPYWRYRRALPDKINTCCGRVNRGVAVAGVSAGRSAGLSDGCGGVAASRICSGRDAVCGPAGRGCSGGDSIG